MKKRLSSFVLPVLSACLLTACGGNSFFVSEENAPLKGERISILQLQKELSPDPALQASTVTLPEAWTNQFWPQGGGYPNHAMGHLMLEQGMKKVWQKSIGKGGDRRTPLIAAPIVAEEMVFALDAKGHVVAFDTKKGKRKWRQSVVPRGEEDSGAVGGGLAYSSGRLYVTNGYKNVSAVNPETGALIWRAEAPAPVRSAPTVAQDRVYVITLDNRLLVYAASDGSLLWQHTGVSEATNLLGSASVAADPGLIVLPLSSGEVYGLRPENGRIVWEDNLSSVRRVGALSSIADIRGLPVIDQGVVYAISYSGRMVALDQVSGRRLWQREIGSAETPWSAGDYVFVVTAEQQLVALTRTEGAIHWTMQLPRKKGSKGDPIVWTGPVLAGDRLIVASSHGRMLEISPQDGSVLKETKLSGKAMIAPVVAAGTLFILTENGRLTAYR